MTYEAGIPEYAMQPAKVPEMKPAEAVYHTEHVQYPGEKRTTVYQFEEDLLVPDTKADMREILLMEAGCSVMPLEKQVMPKTDGLLNLTGIVTLQTLYQPEVKEGDEKCLPVSITSKLQYKLQWSLNPESQGEAVVRCRIKNLEHMVINERKFRVKATLEFDAQLFCQKEIHLFHGLKAERLEMKTVQLPLVCLALVKHDSIPIDESFLIRDSECRPEEILMQSYTIVENYRQITTEKVVIGGFVYVNVLYRGRTGEAEEPKICEHQQRVEFTQFIPIEKAYRGRKWSVVKPYFSEDGLSVRLESSEEEEGEVLLRIKGEISTRLELYEQKLQNMVIDAYHREKNFSCRFSEALLRNLAEPVSAEYSGREIIHFPEGLQAADIACCSCKVVNCNWKTEGGTVMIQGELQSSCLWKDGMGLFHKETHSMGFHTSMEIKPSEEALSVQCTPLVKQCFAALINEKQAEINYQLLLQCDICEERKLILLEEPGFICGAGERKYPMAVVVVREGDCLWDLAKRYGTTEDQIRQINHLTEEPKAGQKLLVMKQV